MDDASTPALLRTLRVTLHVSFAGLLLLGTVRTLVVATDDVVLTLVLSLALAGTYLAATTWESRFSRGRTTRDPRQLALPWLALVTALWGALTLLSPAFSWVVFPLFFVYLVLLARTTALLFLLALTTVVVFAQYLHAAPGGFSPAMVAGPIIGVAFAVVVHQAYRALTGTPSTTGAPRVRWKSRKRHWRTASAKLGDLANGNGCPGRSTTLWPRACPPSC